MPDEYYYLDVELRFLEGKRRVEPAFFKKHLVSSVHQLFGEVSSCQKLDLLRYDPETRRAILRVPYDNYVKVHTSLTLVGNYEGTPCAYRIHKTSNNLLSLTANSKKFFRKLSK